MFCDTWKLYDIRVPASISVNFIGTRPHTFLYILSAAAFTLEGRVGSAEPKIFALWSLTEKAGP